MSAGENIEVINRLATAYAVADVQAIDRLLADDVVFHIPGRHPLSGTYVGKTDVFGLLGKVVALSTMGSPRTTSDGRHFSAHYTPPT